VSNITTEKLIKRIEESTPEREPSKEMMEKMNQPIGFTRDGKKHGAQKTNSR
jgi:uncharacterized protein (UPF0216 family)